LHLFFLGSVGVATEEASASTSSIEARPGPTNTPGW